MELTVAQRAAIVAMVQTKAIDVLAEGMRQDMFETFAMETSGVPEAIGRRDIRRAVDMMRALKNVVGWMRAEAANNGNG